MSCCVVVVVVVVFVVVVMYSYYGVLAILFPSFFFPFLFITHAFSFHHTYLYALITIILVVFYTHIHLLQTIIISLSFNVFGSRAGVVFVFIISFYCNNGNGKNTLKHSTSLHYTDRSIYVQLISVCCIYT